MVGTFLGREPCGSVGWALGEVIGCYVKEHLMKATNLSQTARTNLLVPPPAYILDRINLGHITSQVVAHKILGCASFSLGIIYLYLYNLEPTATYPRV